MPATVVKTSIAEISTEGRVRSDVAVLTGSGGSNAVGYVVVALGSSVGVPDPQMYKTIPVYADSLGSPVAGPTVEAYAAVLDVSPDGDFMVAATDTATIGLFLWNGTGFDSSAVETVAVAQARAIAISPDSATVAVALNGSPYLQAFPVSTAGFGSAYANPSTLPTGAGRGVSWHPSGGAVALGFTDAGAMPFAVWAFSAGWGSKYADPASTFVGTSLFNRFSPEGDYVFVAQQSPLDDADGQFRIYGFTLGAGLGARVAASGSPLAGPIDSDQSDFSGTLVALGTDSQYGFITYSFNGSIGSGVTNFFPDDEFDYAYHLKFSPDGAYLVATAPTAQTNSPLGQGRVTVFSVSGSTLTQIGTTYVDDADGDYPYVGWRDTSGDAAARLVRAVEVAGSSEGTVRSSITDRSLGLVSTTVTTL